MLFIADEEDTIDDGEENTHQNDESTSKKCMYCEKVFSRPSYTKRHEEAHCRYNLQNFVRCILCVKPRFFSRSNTDNYLQHIRENHKQKAYDMCQLCDAVCSTKATLKAHLRTHTDGGSSTE